MDLDLKARLAAFGVTLSKVHGVVLRGIDLYVDDVILSTGSLDRSYALLPGAALGGVLGEQAGVADNWAQTYYHYNDLGTVMVTTDASGVKTDLWEPDAFGNYANRYAAPSSPTRPRIGLTGKEYDEDAELYYFYQRWYDPERGRFISKSPVSSVYEHPYAFCENVPIDVADPTGLWVENVHLEETYNTCIALGGCDSLCRSIAKADNDTDTGQWTPYGPPTFILLKRLLPDPYTNPWNHFPQDLATPYGEAYDAIDKCDVNGFGRALHRVQDFWSHVSKENTGSTFAVPNHVLQWDDPDNVDLNPDTFAATMRHTRNLLSKFLITSKGKYCK